MSITIAGIRVTQQNRYNNKSQRLHALLHTRHCFVFIFPLFLGPCLWHVEILGLWVKVGLQLQPMPQLQ